MAESRAGATGEDGCRRAGYRQRGYHANRVHAGVDADQSPGTNPVIDAARRQPKAQKLLALDVAVLPGRDGCDGCIEGAVRLSHAEAPR